jgi:hypothetical protein
MDHDSYSVQQINKKHESVSRRRARAFICSSPVTSPAFFLCRAQARASPAISAAPWTGTALAFLRAAFSFLHISRPPPPEWYGKGSRQPPVDVCHAPCFLLLSPLASSGGGNPDRAFLLWNQHITNRLLVCVERTPHPPALYKVPPLANSFHYSAG